MAGSEPPALHNALRLRAKPTYQKNIKKYSLCGLQKRKSATSDSTHFAACPKYYIWLVDLKREKFGQSHSSTLVLAVDGWFRASGPPQRSTSPSKTNIPKNI